MFSSEGPTRILIHVGLILFPRYLPCIVGAGVSGLEEHTFLFFLFQYHPDMNNSPGAEEKFKEISAAYEVSCALCSLLKCYVYAECWTVPISSYYLTLSNEVTQFVTACSGFCVYTC